MNSKINSENRLRTVLNTVRARVETRPLVATMLVGFGLVSVAGLASQSPYEDSQGERTGTTSAAINRFWAVYHGNDYDAIPRTQEELQEAIQNDSNNPTLRGLLGATHFWHIGESARDPIPNDPVLAQDMSEAVDSFGQALRLDYYTRHPIGYNRRSEKHDGQDRCAPLSNSSGLSRCGVASPIQVLSRPFCSRRSMVV
jgi:hypothetical protein